MSDIENYALHLIKILGDAGYETRIVGGAVRDALLGIPVSDVDLATTAHPEKVIEILNTAKIKTVPTGLAHGTITAVMEGRGLEITTLRRDIATDGRHATVSFTDDWHEDAARRDFTMNALSRSADGTLYDYFGGLDDAKAGRIRFVGNAAQRIQEDALRLLRFFRFYAWLGKVMPDEETLAACSAAAPMLKKLSRERVWKEVKRLLSAPDPSDSWMLMLQNNIVAEFLPEGTNLATLCNLTSYEHARMVGKKTNPLLRLTALLHGQKCDAVTLKERFALSVDETQKIAQFLKNPLSGQHETDLTTLSFTLHRYGLDLTEEFLVLNMACGAQFNWDSARGMLEKWQPKTFPLKGEDILGMGLPPGPRVGEILHAVEEWWVAQNFVPSHAACIEYAKRMIQN
ncbi:MAG: CCA tRNA nucleotidyltransferase [Alphaproteobacteria bacterium]|nr:CCA tRNA nucleotidyltransferase [Alphaproteobacteria bacterium]